MFKLGYPDSTGNFLIEFTDVAKQDIVDRDFFKGERGGFGDLFSMRMSNKSVITLDCDFMSQATLGDNLLAVLQNRDYPHKLYLHEPAAASQIITFSGISNPSTTNRALYLGADTSPAIASMTEVSTAQYGYLNDWTNLLPLTAAANDYLYLLFQFDLTTFITAYGLEYIRRLTLFLQDLRVYQDTGEEFGFTVEAWNYTKTAWIEVKRQTLTVNISNQQYASLRPCEGFTRFYDFVDANNQCRFRIINLQKRITESILQMDVQNVRLYVNGFACAPSKDMDFNYRGSYTGEGYVGQIKLEEL